MSSPGENHRDLRGVPWARYGDRMLRAAATWWDGIELFLTQLPFTVQVVLVVGVLGPVCWAVASLIDTVVERSVAARLAAVERRRGPVEER